MAMLDLGTLKIEVKVLTDDANKQFDGLKDKSSETAKTVGKDWDKVASDLTKVGSSMTKYVTLPMLAAATAAIKLNSDMTETVNKINVVFGDNSKAVDRWASNSLAKMGLAKQSALDYAAAYGDLGSSMQLSEKDNYKYSTSLVQLAADMASFKNISAERAQLALTGIYTGEMESLKSLGIVMTDANLQAYALANGYAKQYSDMSQAERVTVRYQYVMDSAKNSMGDFARTSEGTANQTRMLGESAKETGAILGDVLAPTANEIVTAANGLLNSIKSLNPEARETVVITGLIAAGIGPLLTMVGKGIKAYNDISKAVAAANIKMQASAGVIGMISIALGLLTAAVIAGVARYNDLTEAANELADANKKAEDSIAASKKTLNDNLVSVEANAQMAQKYCDRLDALSTVEQLSNAQRAESSYLVNQLNALYPELNAQIDDQTGKIVGGTVAIRDQITAMAERAQAQAYEEQYTAVLTANADLLYAAAAAETERGMIVEANNVIISERTQLEKDFQNQTGMWIQAISEMDAESQMNMLNGDKVLKGMVDRYRELGYSVDKNNTSIRALDRELDKNKTATAASEKEVAIAKETYNRLTGAIDALNPALDKTADGIADTGDAAAEADAKIKDYTDDTINGLEKLPGAVRMSAAQATANLVSNNAAMAKWMADLATLVDRGMDEGVVAKLYEMGPSFRNVVSDLATGTPQEMKAFEDALGKSGDLGGKKFTTGVKNSTNDVSSTLAEKSTEVDTWTLDTTTKVAECVDIGIISKLKTVVPAWSAIIVELININNTNMLDYIKSMYDSGKSSGDNFCAGVESAIEAKYSDLYMLGYYAGKQVMAGYNSALRIKSPSGEGKDGGKNWVDGIVVGVVENTNKLVAAARATAKVPADEMRAQLQVMPQITGGTLPVTTNNIYNSSSSSTSKTVIYRGKVEQHLHYTSQPKTAYQREVEQRRASRILAKEVG